ncbi:MAG: methyltransferase domain-containing protein [Luteitalea sp.]|nr:methyltransferase domain-containing protein [Luteitalea sp.]
MQHNKAVDLIGKGVQRGDTAWADLGSGDGTFTRALRELLGPDADIYAVDVDGSTLKSQKKVLGSHADLSKTHLIEADFRRPLELPPLDGMLLANALHFVQDQITVLSQLRGHLKPSGRLLVVEYDITRGSMWVPHPLPFRTLVRLAPAAGFQPPVLLATTPSRFRSQIYSALAVTGERRHREMSRPEANFADRGGSR